MTAADENVRSDPRTRVGALLVGRSWENETRPKGAGNTSRPLTHRSDHSGRGLAMQATRECSVADCDRPFHARGLCLTHYLRDRRRGTTAPLERSPLTYVGVHRRLRRERGPASMFECVDCGDPAGDWSYDYADPEELTGGPAESFAPYSTDLDHYQPRCKTCHYQFDLAQRVKRNPPAAERACTKCGVVKPLEEFPVDSRKIDGRAARCKVCDRVAVARREKRSRKGDRRSRAVLLEEIARLNRVIEDLRRGDV